MPGVNEICNTKMSYVPGVFVLLLRQRQVQRNFRYFAA
jgi:hypothetical protein